MNDALTPHIWPTETGITDIEQDIEELGASEIAGIRAIWSDQRSRMAESSPSILDDFTERLSREWAIETGLIENLYEIERGVTQTLIEQGFQAEILSHGTTNKPKEYVIQLLEDQKDALDGVFDFVKNERELTVSYIKELHAALLRSQDTTDGVDANGRRVEIPLKRGEWKAQNNHPTRKGVTYFYCPIEHVAAEMDRLVSIHKDHAENGIPSEIQAAWIHHRFTQIHPFQDGNGRVARALASLVLVKDGLFPLIVSRDDKPNYIDALEADDHQGDLKPLISLIVKSQTAQFTNASRISETVLAEDDVNAALEGLLAAADKIAIEKRKELEGVFDLARELEDDLKTRLETTIAPTVSKALEKLHETGNATVVCSSGENDYYYRNQIFENANKHLKYFADFSEHRSWVALKLYWTRKAELVFAFHGIGKPFNGSLICAPFMNLRDTNEDGGIENTFIPLTEEGFIFFYNENSEKMLSRFAPWRDSVLKIALKEIGNHL